MFSVLILCSFCALSNAVLQEVSLPTYVPPSQDAILSKYFSPELNETDDGGRNNGRSENLYRAIESMKNDLTKNVTNLRTDKFDNNGTETNSTASSVNGESWADLLRRLLKNSHETTTYRYPTATWTAQQHEKLKEYQKNRLKTMPKVFLMRPSASIKPIIDQMTETTPKPKRGKIKWKDSRRKVNSENLYKKEEVDRFLERSLMRYLVSSNLIENVGNVSVETFSDALKNITREKADRKQFWPYDENKELRIKFRDGVFMKKRNENSSRRRFIDKQLQRRLERMQEYFGSKNKVWRRPNGLEASEAKPEPLVITTEEVSTTTTQLAHLLSEGNNTENTASVLDEVYGTEPTNDVKPQTEIRNVEKPESEELKLSVAETVYYKKRPSTLQILDIEEGETGVIPGVPHVDYPMYNTPPSTGFKCPDVKGDQPMMMADTRTRCQVFYICTGDGPAAAMLCPNGTMFNENVRVCDWWYNVDC